MCKVGPVCLADFTFNSNQNSMSVSSNANLDLKSREGHAGPTLPIPVNDNSAHLCICKTVHCPAVKEREYLTQTTSCKFFKIFVKEDIFRFF